MFIKIDKDGSLLQISSVWENGFLDNEFDIDMEKFMFCKLENGKIVYDEQAYLKMLNDKEKSISIYNEINELENWLANYDKICNEHARCLRLGLECEHDMEKWDKLAIDKIKRLNEWRKL